MQAFLITKKCYLCVGSVSTVKEFSLELKCSTVYINLMILQVNILSLHQKLVLLQCLIK